MRIEFSEKLLNDLEEEQRNLAKYSKCTNSKLEQLDVVKGFLFAFPKSYKAEDFKKYYIEPIMQVRHNDEMIFEIFNSGEGLFKELQSDYVTVFVESDDDKIGALKIAQTMFSVYTQAVKVKVA